MQRGSEQYNQWEQSLNVWDTVCVVEVLDEAKQQTGWMPARREEELMGQFYTGFRVQADQMRHITDEPTKNDVWVWPPHPQTPPVGGWSATAVVSTTDQPAASTISYKSL